MAKLSVPRSALIFLVALPFLACVTTAPIPEAHMSPFLLDNFDSGSSSLGKDWEGFTDRVMGGVSDMRVGVESDGQHRYLAMSGNVSLKNNGGFIQARLLLKEAGKNSFDASGYRGIRLLVRGTGDGYYLFLRSTRNLLPWSFYMAPIGLTEDWQEILVPFSSFTKGDFGAFSELDLKRLASVAVVAYKKEFAAHLELREIGLY